MVVHHRRRHQFSIVNGVRQVASADKMLTGRAKMIMLNRNILKAKTFKKSNTLLQTNGRNTRVLSNTRMTAMSSADPRIQE